MILPRSHQFGVASRFPRNATVRYLRESGIATQGDLDSLEGPRVPRTRGANESANGGTDGTPGAVGRWASVRRSEEDDKERSSSAPSNSVADARLRRRRRRCQVYVLPVQGEQALCWVRQAAPRRSLPRCACSLSSLPPPSPLSCSRSTDVGTPATPVRRQASRPCGR